MANLRADNLTGTGGRNAIDGSLCFDGNGVNETGFPALALADSDDWHFDGDFTFECWFRRGKNVSTSGAFLGQWESGGGTDRNVQLYIGTNAVITGYMNRSTTNYSAGSVTAIPQNVWVHIALVLESSTLRFYLNGVQTATASVSGTQNNSTATFFVGAEANSNNASTYVFNGCLSNVRVVKGTAVYAGGTTFTPPTEQLTVIPGTVLLCCQDSKDATQEATGKTIVPIGGRLPSGNNTIVQNGDFSAGTHAWFGDSGASISASGGVATVTNGGGDNLYAIKQQGVFTAGRRYRVTGTVNATFSGDSIFRVRAGGSAVSWSITNKLTSGTAFYFDTGTITADGSAFEIGSGGDGSSSTITQFTLQDVKVYAEDFNPGDNVLPPVGIDEGVTFKGDTKVNSPGVMYFPTGDTSQRGRGTALYGGGYKTPNSITAIDYLSIQSGGLTQEWGNLSTTQLASGAACSSSTRWVTAGGWTGANNNAIEYVTFTTQGNSLEFGDLVVGRRNTAAVSNSTRGIWGGGYISPADAGTDSMDYITIASTGNAADFGNLSAASKSGGVAGSTTRAVWALGLVAPADNNTLEYVTIATTGNVTNFGDMPSGSNGRDVSGCSSNVRGIYGGGQYPTEVNIINYITIATTGDAVDFGDLTLARGQTGATSNGIRGVFMGGTTNPARVDNIDSVIIATTGNAVNWGDFRTAKTGLNSAASDSHGGLS